MPLGRLNCARPRSIKITSETPQKRGWIIGHSRAGVKSGWVRGGQREGLTQSGSTFEMGKSAARGQTFRVAENPKGRGAGWELPGERGGRCAGNAHVV